MNNLLFTALIIALLYYFFYYLPSPKKLTQNSPTLFEHKETQTDELETRELNNTQSEVDSKEIKKLQKDIQQKEQTITQLQQNFNHQLRKINVIFDPQSQHYETIDFKGLCSLLEKKSSQITKLQSEIRDLAQKPSKSTNSKSSQTDELNTLDALIKNIQELNNSLD